MYRYYIELNTSKEIEEFTDACSKIKSDVIVRGRDEHGSEWFMSAKSILCSLIMRVKLQKKRKHNAHEVNWNTVYVECEEDIYPAISKFII